MAAGRGFRRPGPIRARPTPYPETQTGVMRRRQGYLPPRAGNSVPARGRQLARDTGAWRGNGIVADGAPDVCPHILKAISKWASPCHNWHFGAFTRRF